MSNQAESDFGFTQVRTRRECSNPVFADHKLHHIAILKDFHLGNMGDKDPNGVPGWVSKFVCTGCGSILKLNGFSGHFHPDGTHKTA